MMLTLLLVGMLTLSCNVRPVEASGTIYIRVDGSVDPPGAAITSDDNVTYTLTGNIYDSIVVERNNIVLDGAGYILQGTGSGPGISLTGRSNVTIKNTETRSFNYGILLASSSNNTISGNNITDNFYGIRLWWGGSSFNNTLSGNNITSNVYGIYLYSSPNNVISGNSITDNVCGIVLYISSNNTIRNNDVGNNTHNFGVYGSSLSSYLQDIDGSNTVNGRPIYYWISRQDVAVPLDAGYVALINCTDITVKNLNLANNRQGILMAYTTNSTIAKNSIANNLCGVRLDYSSNNTLSGNNITSNVYGLYLYSSSNNIISGNNITANSEYGVHLSSSSNNTMSGNSITSNGEGIMLASSSSNTISVNNVTDNVYGIYLSSSFNNRIYHNDFCNNTQQVFSQWSTNVWDDGYPSGGNCWSDYAGVDLFNGPYQNETGSDGIGDTPYVIDADNQDNYPLMKPYGSSYDIGITNITTSQTVIGEGYNLNATVEIVNYGVTTETFNVTIYANASIINQVEITLPSRNSTTVTSTWNTSGVPYGNYTITSVVDIVPGEIDTTDNTRADWVVVTIPGDINGDRAVNILDAGELNAHWSAVGQPYDANVDINCDGMVGILDAGIVSGHWFESW